MAKQKEDKRTADLLQSAGASAQARYAARKRAEGYTQVSFWVNEEEKTSIQKLLARLRKRR